MASDKEAEQRRLYEAKNREYVATLKRMIFAPKEEREAIRQEAEQIKRSLDGFIFAEKRPPENEDNLNAETRQNSGGRGGKLNGASHTLKTADQTQTLVIQLPAEASAVDAIETADAGSARQTIAQARPASRQTPVIYEGNHLRDKKNSADPQSYGANPRNILRPDARKVEEYASACARMFGGEPRSTKKKCASKIHRAFAIGIDAETILFEIEDSALNGEKPLNLFCWRMNKRINEAGRGIKREELRRGAPAN